MALINIFEISGHRYAISLADTQELFRIPSVLPLPKAPAIVEGIVNIRGTVVPVLNLRKRFRLPERPAQPSDHLVLAQAGPRRVAFRVDRVLGLQDVASTDIEDATAIVAHAGYVAGVAKLPDGLVLIHDLRTFLSDAEGRDLDGALDDNLAAQP